MDNKLRSTRVEGFGSQALLQAENSRPRGTLGRGQKLQGPKCLEFCLKFILSIFEVPCTTVIQGTEPLTVILNNHIFRSID